MARFPLQFQATDQQGKIVIGETVTLTLTGTSDVAISYEAASGGSAIVNGQLTTDADGRVKYWVDESDYSSAQYFRITLTGSEFVTQVVDDVVVLPTVTIGHATTELDNLSTTSINVALIGAADLELRAASGSELTFQDDADPTKETVLDQDGATTGKKLTLITSHTDNRSITFPDESGTLLTTVSTTSALVTVGTLVSGNATAIISAATTSLAGKSELAIVAEVETGTDTTRTITPSSVPSIKAILQNSQSEAYTTVLADAGKHVYHPGADTTARIWTIDSNANVAYPLGTAITFVNDTSAGIITISITSDTLVLAPGGTTGSRTLAANGMATAIKMTATRWMISGSGLT